MGNKEARRMWGREQELSDLKSLLNKKVSSLAVITGRRRIGKSTLVQFFAKKNYDRYYEFSGLAPHLKQSNQDQLNHFASQLSEQAKFPSLYFTDWNEAFAALYAQIIRETKPVLIFLDEISWMGGHDSDFPGKLKVAWDTKFKQHPKLVLIVCGSVTSWIQQNILKRADFVGRISLELNLQELPLQVLHHFWGPYAKRISPVEKLKIILITGGVPRYLEEIRPQFPADLEIARLCFQSSGFLFNEYEKIFNEIFQKKSKLYRQIVQALTDRHLAAVDIAKKIGRAQNSEISDSLTALELSGFLAKDYVYLPNGKRTKISRYRLKDNYLRFYLRYIEPIRDRIIQTRTPLKTIDHLSNWNIIAGFQFENLVLNHLPEIIEKLGINSSSIISASPYVQKAKTRNKGSCQIDLMIVCKHKTLYLCEIKFRQLIGRPVIKEVQKKIDVLEGSKNFSIRPILIYAGEIDKNHENDLVEFFDQIICLADMIN
jgi:AAA+ ATPase superfamily predicted ATPase